MSTLKWGSFSPYLYTYGMYIFLGFEVDKPSKIFIKTSNPIKYTESDIQNSESLRIDDSII